MSFFKVNEKCNGCLACVQNCPANALNYSDDGNHRTILHNMALCARCGNCWRICPQQAIEFKQMLRGQWEKVAEMELEHCAVCGEPIYTSSFEKTLNDKLDKRVEPLCPSHKKTLSMNIWKRVAPGRTMEIGAAK
ncbi:MAG: 4Fe-4S dicluster domain-containing protein [Deltaproteobacteria bacterium]|nr:4Fe-4S dicluster domain-containing protein [Deltaproteobacteria bacterium]